MFINDYSEYTGTNFRKFVIHFRLKYANSKLIRYEMLDYGAYYQALASRKLQNDKYTNFFEEHIRSRFDLSQGAGEISVLRKQELEEMVIKIREMKSEFYSSIKQVYET